MSTSSVPIDAAARKIEREILRRLASVGQSCIAEQLGIDEGTVSRWKDGRIEQIAKFLVLLGLKATPVEYRCYDETTLAAMFTFAKQRMDQLQSPDQMLFEDDE